MEKHRQDKRIVVFRALWLYSLIVWVYIAVENLIYPAAVYSSNFSYYIPVKTNLLGIIAFAASFVFYLLSRLL